MEGSLARQRAEEWEERFNALQTRVERAEASTRTEAERTRKQLMDSYQELGARTADFEVPDQEPRLHCLEWLQEELLALPAIVEGFMSYASLVTCEGAMNALSREGCRHYEVFDQSDEDFEREIYKVEDPVVKESAGALFDRMWGPHGQEVVRERSDTARGQAARNEKVEDFGALNSVQPDSESNPVAAVSEVVPAPPPETVEGAPDAPAATAAGGGSLPTAAPRAEDPVKMAAEPAAEDPATAGSSQVA